MKFATIACAVLGAASASQVDLFENTKSHVGQDGQDQDDSHLAQLITTALAGAPPGEITEPTARNTDKENDKQTTKGKTKYYSFNWKYACAFTKWTPTNQFLHANKKYNAATMTLERFGFIGEEKKCYWGMVGVFWVTPLKVVQIKP